MGSEHYCLRWNNHQSNLLGVFSQLLQDESLVDVTLACSEGALIKAHKVVLSACSSYFQSLFLDHPEKHPIVILKDVRLAELKTLVEFMYKGEVNVQYCQLSALLKTAESLKVKGLAEMTNQNTTLREPEREPDRLRPHSQPIKSTCDSPVDTALASGSNTSLATSAANLATSAASSPAAAAGTASTNATANAITAPATTTPVSTTAAAVVAAAAAAVVAVTQQQQQQQQAATASASTSTTSTSSTSAGSSAGSATTASTAQKRDASGERSGGGGSPSSSAPPTKRQQMSPERDSSPLPLDLYQGRSAAEAATLGQDGGARATSEERDATTHAISKNNNNSSSNKNTTSSGGGGGIASGMSTQTAHHNNGNGDNKPSRRRDDSDDEDDDDEPHHGITALDSPPARPGSCSVLDVVEKIEEPDSYDEEMDLDDDVEDNSSNDAMGLNMKIGAAISHTAAALALPSPLGGGSGGGGGDPESARSTPAAATSSTSCGGLILASDLTHQQQRATSRSPRDAASIERPGSSGVCGLPSTSAGMSPSSSAAAAAAAGSDALAGTSGLGPVQSVPLSLKKEIDCSEDDNSNSRHMHQPRSASAGGGLGGDLDYRLTTHESLFRHFSSPFSAMGNSSSAAVAAAHCPAPFAFPFTPFGLSLFDIDPSRILGMLRHQTWLAEEALKSHNLLNTPKDFAHRFNPVGDLFAKDFHPNHSHANTADLLAGVTVPSNRASTVSPVKQTTSPQQQQKQAERNAMVQQQQPQYKTQLHHQQQQQQPPQQQQQTFNVRYPSPAAYFHHQQQQQQQQHLKQMSSRQGTPSPHATATSTQTKADNTPATQTVAADDDDVVIELTTTHDDARDSGRESAAHTPNNSSAGTSSGLGTSASAAGSSGALSNACSPLLYKESLEQLLQRRRSGSSLGGVSDSLRSYTQLLLSSSTPGCTDTSSCKEKSSSSSTSSTPPPTSALLAQHQLLTQRLNSPSETSSLFGEPPIEEETRCVVCNAHFPNVWLLEQHATLQHPHIGPGEEKPFICEQCGQSYRYRSAYAKHKEQNHRARLPADKLFTCDVCGMQFRYLKSFKKHRLNHALERLHGKKSVIGKHCITPLHMLGEQDVVTSSQEPMLPDEGGEDLRINVKREQDDDEREQREREDQDCTIDSAGMIICNDNNNSTALATTTVTEANISSSDGIHSTNKGPRLLTTSQMETDPSYHHLQRHPQHQHAHPHHHQQQAPQQPLPPHLHSSVAGSSLPPHQHAHPHAHVALPHSHHPHAHHAAASSLNSLNSLNSITSLINAERIPNEQFLGLNPQEASILNFLRVDAAERQRDKRPQTSRFACPFCGKCVRSKENLKLHVRKHTGERPFVCLFCGRAFGGKSDLTRHLRIHTGERPYHCESCGKCFARADYLSKHLTTHIHNAPR
ncbi:platelet binding protein GspB [Bactrocera tryoni]|uniref:platelet binding protein GspB n=1 Tax=Bactrocera tryoni TaxID=59916 RepID=UPI001A995588|nr:platelet binding protein GspB [Bactrocera tryoni]XP_039961415.1 platelet binding protein GspB [Bactrocera tryoni]XP_039961416.1 platelet binding protein GspB [Bactrocera tryoni]